MKVTIEIDTEFGDESKLLELYSTENYNFVELKITDGERYVISVADLYRATLPFMDMRNEERREES